MRTRSYLSSTAFGLTLWGALSAGCLGIAGLSDFRVDDTLDGASPLPDAGTNDASATEAPDAARTDASDGSAAADASDGGAEIDAMVDAADAAPPPSPGLSFVHVPGTGVLVGATTTVTLTSRNETGDPVPRVGSVVTFATSGGTSVVTFGPVSDLGDGRYRATVTGTTAGTKVDVTATLDGAALKTPPVPLRVVAANTAGLTFHMDAANADGAGNFGGAGCPAAGRASVKDLSTATSVGTFVGFANPCAVGSGWAGAGTPQDPHRLTFDGQDDHVSFGAVNALAKYTVIAWVRKTGAGTLGNSGNGGLPAVFPILSKGSAEAESGPVDINYFLAIDESAHFASDYEQVTTSNNTPLTGTAAVRDDEWAMVATTLDATAAVRANWVNGVQDVALAPVAGPSPATMSLFVIGGSNRTSGLAQGRFKGDVAVVLTYDRALASAELVAACHAYSTRFGFMTCPP